MTAQSWLRRIQKSTLSRLPRRTRLRLIRDRALFDERVLEGIQVEIASSVADYLAAFGVVHDAYVERGWIRAQDDGLWPTAHHMFPESTLFVLRRGEEVLGTATLNVDSSIGLPIDETFADDVARIRAPGRRVAEIGSLAFAPGSRRSGLPLVLLVALFRYATRTLGISDLVIVVSAHLADHHQALFDLQAVGGVRSYGGFRVGSRARAYDPVVALHQQTERVLSFVAQRITPPPAGRFNALSLYFGPPAPHEQGVPYDAPAEALVRRKLPRDVFQQLFISKTNLLRDLGREQREHLCSWRTLKTLGVAPSRVDSPVPVAAPDPSAVASALGQR